MLRQATLGFLVAALAVGLTVGAAQAGKAKKLRSQIEIEWYDNGGAGFELFGDVHSKKNKCERNRTVTLTDEAGTVVGTDTTDRTGDWSIPTDLDFNAPWVATVEKRKLGNGDKRLVCKAADSPPFVVVP